MRIRLQGRFMHFPIAPAKQQRPQVSVGLHACIQLLTDVDKNVYMTGKACEPHTLPTFLNAYTQRIVDRKTTDFHLSSCFTALYWQPLWLAYIAFSTASLAIWKGHMIHIFFDTLWYVLLILLTSVLNYTILPRYCIMGRIIPATLAPCR